MTTIERGRYPIHTSLEWWNEVNDFVRRREVAAALDLPAEAVEIVFDSDEEADLASVWLVADGREQVIGHVTTETDGSDGDYLPELRQGMIVVEVLDDITIDGTPVYRGDYRREDYIDETWCALCGLRTDGAPCPRCPSE